MSKSPLAWAVALCAVAAAIAILLVQPAVLPPKAVPVAALCLVTITLFATGLVPEQITALGFFTIAVLFAVAPPGVVFAGFETSAFWLVVGGLFIGQGVQHTGLGARLARTMLLRMGGSYFRVILGLTAAALLLMVIMPSVMGRVLILAPLAMAFADRLGFEPGSRGRNGMIIAVAGASFMTAGGILPSNVGNMILSGISEQLYDIKLTFGAFALAQFPTLALLKAGLIVGIIWLMFRVPLRGDAAEIEEEAKPWTGAERRMAVILAGALLVWSTDFLHGFNPGWVGLAAGFICMLPGIGVLPIGEFDKHFKFGAPLYTAGILGFSRAMDWSGLGTVLGKGLITVVPFTKGGGLWDFLCLYFVASVLGIGISQLGVPATLTPLARDIAEATGLPLYTVLMTIVAGFSNLWLPYQTAPMVIALRMSGVGWGAAAKATLILGAATLVLLAPLTFLWWLAIGLIG